jgi:hypothetical protein
VELAPAMSVLPAALVTHPRVEAIAAAVVLNVTRRSERQHRALRRAIAPEALREVVVLLNASGARELARRDARAVPRLAIGLDARDDLDAFG